MRWELDAPARLVNRAFPAAPGMCYIPRPTMATKLESFLSDKKIDHRRILIASKQIEKLRLEDRRTRLKLKQARKSEDAKRPEGIEKPRSGKPVTSVGLRNALAGSRTSSSAKSRILRAVNRILEQRKKSPVALDTLFDLSSAKPAATEKADKE
jgi:hypothetical protein